MLRPSRSVLTLLLALFVIARPAAAQDHDESRMTIAGSPAAWNWAADGEVFFGFNYQHREFTDFAKWESQNWFMLSGERPVGAGQLMFHGMASLEPFTLERLGSHQLFQTGESYYGSPLIDRQHPHDLVMGLGAMYRLTHGRFAYTFEASLVGSPALGPPPFMHRESGRDQPTAPLTHHYLDSTHITPGVVTAGVGFGGLTLEASAFRGEEPNDNRLNIDRPRLDSWSARARWRRGGWDAQVSGAYLTKPEWFEPYDVQKVTASVGYAGAIRSRPLAALVGWGENREVHGILDGYLFEWKWGVTSRGSIYGRAESAAKNLLDLGGPDPPGFIEFHRISHVAALTGGYLFEIAQSTRGRVAIGGDVSFYHVPENMIDYYGTSPHSFHVFLSWRPVQGPRFIVHGSGLGPHEH